MESLKTRHYTIKNTPIPDSAKRFDRPIPWYALGALKPMGRMDGDVAIGSGIAEANTIDGWRRECERLRQENERLKAQRGDAIVGENEALRIIIRHLAKIL
jgi:hypothetical protein